MPEPTSRNEKLAFLAILAAVLALRAWGLDGLSFTRDELYDLSLARCNVSEIIHRADGFPPLYALTLHGWLAVFGSDAAARWLSVVCGLGAIPLVRRLARQVGGAATGLWAAAILAVAPIHVYFSQETRAYGLYFFWAAASLWALVRARRSNRGGDWAMFAVACLGGLYTHYYFAILVVTLAVLLLARRWGDKRKAESGKRNDRGQSSAFRIQLSAFSRPLAAFLAVVLGSLPLLDLIGPDLALQVGYPGQTGFGAAQWGYTYFSFLSGFTLGPSMRDLHTLSAGNAVRQSLPWLAVLGLVAVPLAYCGLVRLRESRQLADWLVLLIAPVMVVGALGVVAHVGYKVSYVVWATIPLILILAAGCSKRNHRIFSAFRFPLSALLFAVFCVALYNRHYVDRYRNEDAAGVAAYLRSQPNTHKPVFAMSFYIADPVRYYLGEGWDVKPLPNAQAGGDEPGIAVRPIDCGVPAGAGYWLVYSRPFHGDPKGTFLALLVERDHLRLMATFAGIALPRRAEAIARWRITWLAGWVGVREPPYDPT